MRSFPGDKVPQDAQDFKDELKRIETFVLELQKKVIKECEQYSEDVKFWAEYKTGIKEFKPWLESVEKKSQEGLQKPQTLEEANETASRHAALSNISADDPPIFMSYGMSPTAKLPSDPKRIRGWLIHHVNLGIALKEKTDDLKLEAHLKYPGAKPEYESQVDFFVEKLLEQ